MTPEIPILFIPIVNRGDLLTRCLNSLDYPIGKIVICKNSDNKTVNRAIDAALKIRANIDVLSPGWNQGVSTSWNQVMRDYPAPLHFMCSNDISFKPGDLQKMMECYYTSKDPLVICGNHGFAFFIITRKAVEVLGTFDENLYPAYMEDVDMARRLSLAGYDLINAPNVNAIHGEPPWNGSSTIKSNPDLDQKNSITFSRNGEYYERKWGGPCGKETFARPFNDSSWPINKWVLEEDRVKQSHIW